MWPHLDMGVTIISSSRMATTFRLCRGTERRLNAGHCEQHPVSMQWFEFHPTHPYDLGGDEHGVEWTTPTCPVPGGANTDSRPED